MLQKKENDIIIISTTFCNINDGKLKFQYYFYQINIYEIYIFNSFCNFYSSVEFFLIIRVTLTSKCRRNSSNQEYYMEASEPK